MKPSVYFLENAASFASSARILLDNDNETVEILAAPILHSTAMGYELFLKSVLLRYGVELHRLDKPEHGFGHQILKMWERPELEGYRSALPIFLENFNIQIRRGPIYSSDRRTWQKEEETFRYHLLRLDALHSHQPYPLRYPTKQESAPYPRTLIYVLNKLISQERLERLVDERKS